MKHTDIHIGDVLKIREWEDMYDEFGVNGLGNIPCPVPFTTAMQDLCGKRFTVRYIQKNSSQILAEEKEFKFWNISADMLEPFWETDELDDINDSELIDILGG